MRYATLKAPVDGRIDVSVTVLPGEAGGELANVNSWRGQIGLRRWTPRLPRRGSHRTKRGTVSIYDFTNDAARRAASSPACRRRRQHLVPQDDGRPRRGGRRPPRLPPDRGEPPP
jgi:hypothetical protein